MTPPKPNESRLLSCVDRVAEVPALELGTPDDEKDSLVEWLRSRFSGGVAPWAVASRLTAPSRAEK